jgi:hypothetical protein
VKHFFLNFSACVKVLVFLRIGFGRGKRMIAAHSQVDGLALHATAVADAHPKDSDPFCEGHCVLITPKLKNWSLTQRIQ